MAYVKPSDAGVAAAYIIRQCVRAAPPQGGVSKNFGRWQVQALRSDLGGRQFADQGHPGDTDDLAVIVRKYSPRVVCSEQLYPLDSAVLEACEAIVDQMEVSKQERIFAQQNIHDPNLETPLPAWYKAPTQGSRYPPP